ncbi:MAG: hypothetical protein IH988_01340 [Planctomycetes bacterium]|nr:hypothetical protein [Planctomycetota bacterium]
MTEQLETRRSGWFKLGVALIALIAVGATAFYLWGWSAHRRWDNYAAFLQASGEPLTYAEIEARRTMIPNDQNGAMVIEALIEGLDAIADDPDLGPVLLLGKARDDGPEGETQPNFFRGVYRHTIKPSREFLTQHGTLVEAIREVRHFPGGRFAIEYSPNPLEILLPHSSATRTAAKMLSLDAILALIDGDLDRAIDEIAVILRLADLLNEEPFTISRLVQVSIHARAIYDLQNTLRVGELPALVLIDLDRQIADRLSSSSMRWALWGERASINELCENLVQGQIMPTSLTSFSINPTPPLGQMSWTPRIFMRKNQYEGVRLLSALIDEVDDPQALIAAAGNLDAGVDALSDLHMIIKMLLPSLEVAVILDIRCHALMECARAALAAERFRMANGRLLDSPDELVPDWMDQWPDDPLDGRPMRFKSTEEGILIYNVGRNLTDDGGQLNPPEDQRRNRDEGFRLFKLDRRGLLIIDETPHAEPASAEQPEE